MTIQKKRLAVLLTHPVQYFKPIFKALAASQEIELMVFFGCNHGIIASHDPDFGLAFAWDNAPTEGFNHFFISRDPLKNLSSTTRALQLAWFACQKISAFKPDLILIFAYSPLFITASTLLLAASGINLLLRADGTDRAFNRSTWKSWLKDLLLRPYYRLFIKIFPIGKDSNDHFARLGVTEKHREMVPFAVDVNYFQQQVEYWQAKRSQLRAELGIPDTAEVLLSVGKITAIKGQLLIADALSLLPLERRKQIWLVVVGDGPLRQALTAALNAVLPGCYFFMGFQNQSQLGRFYTVADSFIFPSLQGETWGLVVNEALQFGLRVVASDHPGCVRDLLQTSPHQIFKTGNSKDLSAILNKPWKKENCDKLICGNLPKPEHLADAIIKSALSI
jgi:glycosyltransferase involved in cell wall biosynthesis